MAAKIGPAGLILAAKSGPGDHFWQVFFAKIGPAGPIFGGTDFGVTGPLLFLVYVNDIPDYISNSVLYLFADDTKCLKTIFDPADSIQLQDDINSLNHWSEQWSLLFNPTKIVQIIFKPNLQTSYTIGTSLTTSRKS